MEQNLQDLIGASERKLLCCYYCSILDSGTFNARGMSQNESRSYNAQKEGVDKDLVEERKLYNRNKTVVEGLIEKYESILKSHEETWKKERNPIQEKKDIVKKMAEEFEGKANVVGHQTNNNKLGVEEYATMREILKRNAKDSAIARIKEILEYERSHVDKGSTNMSDLFHRTIKKRDIKLPRFRYSFSGLDAKVVSGMEQNLQDLFGASERKLLWCYYCSILESGTFISNARGMSQNESRSYNAQKEGLDKDLVEERKLYNRNKTIVEGLIEKYESILKSHEETWKKVRIPIQEKKDIVKQMAEEFEGKANIVGHQTNNNKLDVEEYATLREILKRDPKDSAIARIKEILEYERSNREILKRDAKDSALTRIKEILEYERSHERGSVDELVQKYENKIKQEKGIWKKKKKPIEVQNGQVEELIVLFEGTGNITENVNIKLMDVEESVAMREILKRDTKEAALSRIQKSLLCTLCTNCHLAPVHQPSSHSPELPSPLLRTCFFTQSTMKSGVPHTPRGLLGLTSPDSEVANTFSPKRSSSQAHKD
ncbi:uncharacterized protein [Palaemon carinicauda]|uniref:uncharacterized protein n=1 Tax=Palaemon carinicauda TaxID=392227 RepID=UPI0035B5BA59